jgi:hypothetical protein
MALEDGLYGGKSTCRQSMLGNKSCNPSGDGRWYLVGSVSSRSHQARAGGLASTSQRSAAALPADSEMPNPGHREITNDGGSGGQVLYEVTVGNS